MPQWVGGFTDDVQQGPGGRDAPYDADISAEGVFPHPAAEEDSLEVKGGDEEFAFEGSGGGEHWRSDPRGPYIVERWLHATP